MAPRYRKWLIAYLIGILALIIALHLEWPWVMAGSSIWSGAGDGPRRIRVHIVLGDAPSAGQGQQLQLYYRTAGDWRWREDIRVLPSGASNAHYAMDGDHLRIAYHLPPDSRGDMIVLFK